LYYRSKRSVILEDEMGGEHQFLKGHLYRFANSKESYYRLGGSFFFLSEDKKLDNFEEANDVLHFWDEEWVSYNEMERKTKTTK
jgi:hypothetical protein